MDGITDIATLIETLKELLGYKKQTRLSIQLYPEVKLDLRSLISGKLPFSAQFRSVFKDWSPNVLDLDGLKLASALLYSTTPLAIRNR